MTKRTLVFIFLAVQSLVAMAQTSQKAPAYPLITHDPYFSIWSFGDELNASTTKHWTGADQSLLGYIKVDGKTYRFLGKETKSYETLLPAADEKGYNFTFTESNPGENWMQMDFNHSNWQTSAAPFGDNDRAQTNWNSDNLWVRRTFELDDNNFNKPFLKLHHDDNVEVYLNGKIVYQHEGWNDKFDYFPLDKTLLKKGKNLLAIHVANTAGGRWLDVGIVDEPAPKNGNTILAAKQKSVELNATQTIYEFKCGDVDLNLTFTSPLLLDDLDLLARPVSYISYKVKSNDGKKHEVQIYMGASSNIATNTPAQQVEAEKYSSNGLSILKAGTIAQPVLEKSGDNLRIDWGYMYLAVPLSANAQQYVSSANAAKESFVSGNYPKKQELRGRSLMLNTVLDLGKVGNKSVEKYVMLAYDDLYSIQYFGENLKPWWKQDPSQSIEKELSASVENYATIMAKCDTFNKNMYADASEVGGENYAHLCVLAYRQSISAHKLVKSPDGEMLFLSKENFSNGCINTVDLTYPSAPLFLIYNPDLMKGMMNGIFYYSESGKWKKPFPAHDIGTYPLANGQVYGEDMPVEEAGNMIILAAAIARAEGNADYSKKHWETISTWAAYLLQEGFDPENQLCTDDFAGHMARNVNLSAKAIVALRSYAMLANMLGEKETYQKYKNASEEMVRKWMNLADDGDHYTLAFEKNGTWSQKYNLVWDKVFDLDLFPKEVYKKEINFYLTKQNTYGLPLDSRKTYTKSDWIIWTATMTDNRSDFDSFIDPLYRYVTETPDRAPLSDWHETTNAEVMNFRARSVVGAYFMPILEKHLR